MKTGILVFLLLLGRAGGLVGAQPELPQEAYVWQRHWTPELRAAVTNHAPSFSGYVALAMEIAWRRGQPEIVRVPVDFTTLRASGKPIGLALRIGPFPGPFLPNDATAHFLSERAAEVVGAAGAAGVIPRELQIDFDCATAKLTGYQTWVETLRQRIAPIPLIITVLPAWLSQPEFRSLAAAADGFILQVHSMDRPQHWESQFTLCDPAAARLAVATAARLGLPFCVALPTYGYQLGFNATGDFLGLSAEGPARLWPPGTRVREVHSDAPALAGLVRDWVATTPPHLQGIIWYRLPISLDALNWPWPTLKAVMEGRVPREHWRVERRPSVTELVEIELQNDGEMELTQLPIIDLTWHGARLVASDGLQGYATGSAGPDHLTLRPRAGRPVRALAPGDKQTVGWLRLDRNTEVNIESKLP